MDWLAGGGDEAGRGAAPYGARVVILVLAVAAGAIRTT